MGERPERLFLQVGIAFQKPKSAHTDTVVSADTIALCRQSSCLCMRAR